MSYAMPLLLKDISYDKIILPDYKLPDLQALLTFIYSGGGWWEAHPFIALNIAEGPFTQG